MKITLKPLDQQVMLITGASSGIGLVTAKAAAARGARVMLVARNRDALVEAVREIELAGGAAAFGVADVGDADQVRAAADEAVARFGRIDTWVNNAGVAIYAQLGDTPLDEHERLFRTNYFGVVNGCQAAIPLLKGGGALITVGSITSDLPTPILSAYAASKHAAKAYVEALRMELHADGLPIAVTLIKPSGIDTPIGQHAANHGDGKGMQGEALVPPPVYAPELVADAILYAAEHVRRDITVGGVGRLQVLVGQHFPWLIDPDGAGDDAGSVRSEDSEDTRLVALHIEGGGSRTFRRGAAARHEHIHLGAAPSRRRCRHRRRAGVRSGGHRGDRAAAAPGLAREA